MAAKRKLTPEQIAEKLIRNAGNAVQDYKDGVGAVTESPTAKAALKLDKLLQNLMEAINSGRMADSLNAVGLMDWIKITQEKGGANYARGIQLAKPVIIEFQRQFSPVRESVAENVRAMPNDTYEQRKARMNANADGLHAFKFRRSSRRSS
jgi:hypothetical protein